MNTQLNPLCPNPGQFFLGSSLDACANPAHRATSRGKKPGVATRLLVLFRSVLVHLMLLPLLVLIAGCDARREFRILLLPEEPVTIEDKVTLDGRAVGVVARIEQAGKDRVAVLRITDRVARNTMRVGVEREARGRDITLTSEKVLADAPLLESGALIPTRQPAEHLSRRVLFKAEEWAWWLRDCFADHPLLGVLLALATIIVVVKVLRAIFACGR